MLLVNNVRDMHGDARSGRKTLAILIGVHKARTLYAAFVMVPYVILAASVAFKLVPMGTLLGLLTVPVAFKAISAFRRTEPSLAMNPLLGQTVRLQGLFAFSTAIGMFQSPGWT